MDVSTITQIISSLGFPIVMCCILIWYIKYTIDKYMTQIEKINEAHKNEMNGITEALNNNTVVIQKLCDKMDNIVSEV